MKKVLFFTIILISSFGFATIQLKDFQEEILKTKIEQELAYAGVKLALGEDDPITSPSVSVEKMSQILQAKYSWARQKEFDQNN